MPVSFRYPTGLNNLLNQGIEMKKYKQFTISSRTICTAIFEYLERRGYKPDRKRGIKTDRFDGASLMVQVKKSPKEIVPGGKNLYYRKSLKELLEYSERQKLSDWLNPLLTIPRNLKK